MDVAELKAKLGYLAQEKLVLIDEAYQFALQAHQGQVRISGEPYFEHPLQTAITLADLQLDAYSIAAALLHDVPEDCGVPLEEIEHRFGAEVKRLVDGATKLSRIARQATGGSPKPKKGAEDAESRAESLRRMLVAMAEDVRVVLIKLADRLHNMRTLGVLPPQKRRGIAQETLDIYAPLAHRLGIWEIKWQLEDLSFRYLQPERYREISRLVATRRAAREKYIDEVIQILRQELKKAGIKTDVTGRPKHIYSIYQKMERYALQGKDFGEIHDLLALRILVDEVKDCYAALGIIHSLWHPLPGQFNDYIANPKANMYQSLHTTVMCIGGTPMEIQIRTHEMHRTAEYGIAAHWRYKEGTKKDMRFEEKIAWLRQLMDWQRELSGAVEFVESVKTDIFRDQVFVYTPKGEIKELPAGSTPLDFAYRIHTELGHQCIGAKVNGRLVPLDYQLRTGDTVEILTAKGRGPSLDWLNPNLGFIKTSHARDKVRQWFTKRERNENIQRGKELLEKELRRLGIGLSEEEDIANLFKYETLDDFLAALGCGTISTSQIGVKLAAPLERPIVLPEVAPRPSAASTSVQVLGVGELLTHLAPCCNPVPGDEIIGYITRSRGVTVHRKDCVNIAHEDEKERLIRVDWGHTNKLYPVAIRIEAWDRVGLLRDVSTIVSEDKVNMTAVSTAERDDHKVSIFVTVETTGIEQLSRLLSKLEVVKGIISVARNMEGAKRESA